VFDLQRYKDEQAKQQVKVEGNITKISWGTSSSNVVTVGTSAGNVHTVDVRTMKTVQTAAVEGGVMDMELNEGLKRLTVSSGKKVTVMDKDTMEVVKTFDMPISFKEEVREERSDDCILNCSILTTLPALASLIVGRDFHAP